MAQVDPPAFPAPSSTAVVTAAALPVFELKSPELIVSVPVEATPRAVPLTPEKIQAVDDQGARFIDALMTENVHSAEFKTKLDSAFALGREEISNATGLKQGRFL